MSTDGKAPGGNLEPRGQGRERGSIRLVKSCDGDRGAGAAVPRPDDRTGRARPEREALLRVQVAQIALRDGLRTKDLEERREWFLLARGELREAAHRIEADLDRLPPGDFGPWRVREARNDAMRQDRLDRWRRGLTFEEWLKPGA